MAVGISATHDFGQYIQRTTLCKAKFIKHGIKTAELALVGEFHIFDIKWGRIESLSHIHDLGRFNEE